MGGGGSIWGGGKGKEWVGEGGGKVWVVGNERGRSGKRHEVRVNVRKGV